MGPLAAVDYTVDAHAGKNKSCRQQRAGSVDPDAAGSEDVCTLRSAAYDECALGLPVGRQGLVGHKAQKWRVKVGPE